MGRTNYGPYMFDSKAKWGPYMFDSKVKYLTLPYFQTCMFVRSMFSANKNKDDLKWKNCIIHKKIHCQTCEDPFYGYLGLVIKICLLKFLFCYYGRIHFLLCWEKEHLNFLLRKKVLFMCYVFLREVGTRYFQCSWANRQSECKAFQCPMFLLDNLREPLGMEKMLLFCNWVQMLMALS